MSNKFYRGCIGSFLIAVCLSYACNNPKSFNKDNYLKFENGHFAKQQVHLKVHQLSKDRIKVEGIAYRSPNNRLDTQTVSFLAYTTPEQKSAITDNEHDCQYQFNYSKALLSVKTSQKGCERFAGVYRLYD